jgi:hypothetical protein
LNFIQQTRWFGPTGTVLMAGPLDVEHAALFHRLELAACTSGQV